MSKTLTIGMATYDDYHGVFFTIQALRIYHDICNTDEVEFIVLDNNPDSTEGKETKKYVESINQKYIPFTDSVSSFNKYKIADHATGKYVLILDCHVLLEKDGIQNLLDYYKNNPNCKDLVQGPLWYDDLKHIATHFDPVFRGDMYGTWGTNNEAYDKGEPFEIPMQGMGMLSFEKSAWKGISQRFIGFGAEEGYISEKFRQWGGKNVCLPNLKWNHRFGRPEGAKFRLNLEDRLWNYYVGWLDLYEDKDHEMIKKITEHFKKRIPEKKLEQLLQTALNNEPYPNE